MPRLSWSLFGGDYRTLVRVFFAGGFLIVREKRRQRFVTVRNTPIDRFRVEGNRCAQRLGEPAGSFQQALGFFRHFCLLKVVDELRGLFALRLADRLEDAGLGYAAEIVVARGPPAGFDHVEPDRARETIGLGETALHAMNRHTRAA